MGDGVERLEKDTQLGIERMAIKMDKYVRRTVVCSCGVQHILAFRWGLCTLLIAYCSSCIPLA
jgi:hypothetical protein